MAIGTVSGASVLLLLLIAGTRSEDAHLGLDHEMPGFVHVRVGLSRGHPAKHQPSPPLGWRDLLWLRELTRFRRAGDWSLSPWGPTKQVLEWTRNLTDEEWEHAKQVVRVYPFLSFLGLLWAAWRFPPTRPPNVSTTQPGDPQDHRGQQPDATPAVFHSVGWWWTWYLFK